MSLESLQAACRDLDPEPIASLTMDLLDMWSPPGDEGRVAERLKAAFEEVGAKVRFDTEYPSSPSVIAEFGQGSPTIQWHGHIDAIDTPHAPARREGDRLIGRGANDMKGPCAAMVEAARLLITNEFPSRGRVLVTLHGMHESGGNEPLHGLLARGIHGDAVITGEVGGGKALPIASLGLTIWEIRVSRPGEVTHEIYVKPGTPNPVEAGRILHNRLAELRDRLAAAPGPVEKPSLFIGKFVSGDYFNRLPVVCELAGSRRNDRSMTLQQVSAELEALVAEARRETDATIELKLTPAAEAWAIDAEDTIVRSVCRAHEELTGVGLTFSTSRVIGNAGNFVHEAGIPAVCYGVDQSTSHSDHEVVELAELRRQAAGIALASAYYLADGA
jgi:acetylornithine deacetylase/succinyl-diaminopimelate desuccinylase-like protein